MAFSLILCYQGHGRISTAALLLTAQAGFSTIKSSGWRNREDEGVLLVPKAGEMLYRLADGSVPRIG